MDESFDLKNRDIALITTAPHNFAGAGTIHARILCLLASRGFNVTYIGFDKPFLCDQLVSNGVNWMVPRIKSDAYPNSDVVSMLAVIKEILQQARKAYQLGKKIVLMGTYIFPYQQSIVIAAQFLMQEGIRCKTIAIPAGSDIWQVGIEIPEVSLRLLQYPQTDVRVTYSHQFSREIHKWIGNCGPFSIIPPPIDTGMFRPLLPQEKCSLRNKLGIPLDSFVIVNCSNMRPIKGINNVIEIALEFSSVLNKNVILLLVGPITKHLQEVVSSIGFNLDCKLPALGKVGKLTVMAVGLQSNTNEYHAVSDVALNASIHDSFNTSLAESMACGIPVITSDAVGIARLINNYSCGHLFSYSNNALDNFRLGEAVKLPTKALSETVQFLLLLNEKPLLCTDLGQKGRSALIQHCAGDAIYKQWSMLINTLVVMQNKRAKHGVFTELNW